ncbi:hypothetical protein Zmor_008125 [Zophobas morio]|uniref:Uncharacterized protein n=1 Tax=Zophobas morio TaxID=2755281 RepID=A0AA38MQE4_9CUCU|nr:hypothetical protein Zmor_008125 [Zophobas morio]
MAPTLYVIPASSPVRAVLMTAKAIGLNLELKTLDMSAGEHTTPEFLKMNPQHSLPTLVDDDGYVLWDSHAIMAYLVSNYATSDSLYPSDIKTRALVDQRLHFDSSVVFRTLTQILRPMIFQGKKNVDQKDTDSAHEVYSFVETFLEGREWISGDSVTIADFSFISSLTSFNVAVKIEESKYPKLAGYLKRAECLPGYEANKEGLEAFIAIVKPLLK